MPQKRPEGTPDEEIEEWARRMMSEVEDFDYTDTRQHWLEFVNNKLFEATGRHGSDSQLAALEGARFGVVDWRMGIAIDKEQPFTTRPDQVRYRDVTGLIQKPGTWVSKANVGKYLYALTHPGRR